MDLIEYLLGASGKDVAERFQNPIKSDYQKRFEQNGWNFVTNHSFRSMLDELEEIEKLWGENIIFRRETLIQKMRKMKKFYKKIYSTEKVAFARTYDIYGKIIPKDKNLFAAVYLKFKEPLVS